MPDEIKEVVYNSEIIDFGSFLNNLDDSTGFEIENASDRFESVSKDEVIKRFQEFYDMKTARFKVHLTYLEHGQLVMKTEGIVRIYPK